MARSAEDCALLLSAMSGFDARDSTSAERPPQDFHAGARPRARRRHRRPAAARPAHRPAEGVLPGRRWPPTSKAALRAALAELEQLGATLVDVSLPRTELSIPVYYIIAPAEASSNLSRFDGVRYGHRAEHYDDLRDMYKDSRAEGFGPEVKRRIMIGTYVLSHGYYDAYYLQAQKLRRMIADDFQACFRRVRRDRRPGGADRRLEARRAERRPGRQLPGRHLHAAGEPGRPARHERARPASAPAACRSACS